jgi:hypothetical protein
MARFFDGSHWQSISIDRAGCARMTHQTMLQARLRCAAEAGRRHDALSGAPVLRASAVRKNPAAPAIQ